MATTTITTAFEQWCAKQVVNNQPARPDRVVFALIPNLDHIKSIPPNVALPKSIVYECDVTQSGVINENAVAFSVVLDSQVGDFDFNFMALVESKSKTVCMVVHSPIIKKIKSQNGLQGNSLTRTFVMEFSKAAEATQINVSAQTWQIDYSARLKGIDESVRVGNTDLWGNVSILSGFDLSKNGNQVAIKPGLAYVCGLRVDLKNDVAINVKNGESIFIDACLSGAVTGQWTVKSEIKTGSNFTHYVDHLGIQHYVEKIADVDNNGQLISVVKSNALMNTKTLNFDKKQGWIEFATISLPHGNTGTILITVTGGAGNNKNTPRQANKTDIVIRPGRYNEIGFINVCAYTLIRNETFAEIRYVHVSNFTYKIYVKTQNSWTRGLIASYHTTSNASVVFNDELIGCNPPLDSIVCNIYEMWGSHNSPYPASAQELAELTKRVSPKWLGELDLNNIIEVGDYYQNQNVRAIKERNYPIQLAGSLQVLRAADSQKSKGVTQTYSVYNTGRVFVRGYYAGIWSEWSSVYDSNNKPTAVEIAAYPATGGDLDGSVSSLGTHIGFRGNQRQHFVMCDADGKARAYIYSDHNKGELRFNNGRHGGSDFVMHSSGIFQAPNALIAGDAVYQSDGNIKGPLFGGHLSDFLQNMRPTSGSGWWRCPSTGLIIQWGRVDREIRESLHDISWPIPFPRGVLSVNVTLINSDHHFACDLFAHVGTYSLVATHFVFSWYGGLHPARGFFYMALGY